MVGTTCEKCGFTPKNPARSLFYSAMFEQTQCVNAAACLARIERIGRKKDPTAGMNAAEMREHNDRMENDPGYRDMIHYERN